MFSIEGCGSVQNKDRETKMIRILKILSNAQLMVLVFFSNIIFTWAFLHATVENNFTTNFYYLSERFDYLVMSVIGYNIVSRKYHILVLPACAIALLRFLNELLHIFNFVSLNNPILLAVEFTILLIFLWRISKVTY